MSGPRLLSIPLYFSISFHSCLSYTALLNFMHVSIDKSGHACFIKVLLTLPLFSLVLCSPVLSLIFLGGTMSLSSTINSQQYSYTEVVMVSALVCQDSGQGSILITNVVQFLRQDGVYEPAVLMSNLDL